MKKMLLGIFLMGFVFVFVQGAAQATSFTFGDESIYWASWQNGTTDDSTDEIGRPEFTGGGGTIDTSGYLTGLYFNYLQGAVHAGDVFIDVGSDGYWDYVIVSDADTPDDSSTPDPGWNQGVYEVTSPFSVTKGMNDGYYLLSNAYYPIPPWTSDNYRENHPVTASEDAPLNSIDNSINFTDFSTDAGTSGQVIFADLDGILVGTNNNFTIGFAPTCANDVIYQHVPEPATVLLIGFGLVGLGLCSSSKMRKSCLINYY